MKTTIKLKGRIADLNNITLFEIWKAIETAPSNRVKIDINGIKGEIIKSLNTTAFDVVKAISKKAKRKKTGKTAGELKVIDNLVEEMNKVYIARSNKMLKSIEAVLSKDLKKGGKYPVDWFKPPQTVSKEAERGLELRRKYGRGGLDTKEASKHGIGSGVQRAVNLKNRDTLSPETIKRMRSFFARHEKNKDGTNEKGEPKAGKIAWLLWGGDSGRAWSNKVYNKMEQYDKINKKKNRG